VEQFLDVCLSLDNLIDLHSTGIRRRAARAPKFSADEKTDQVSLAKLPSKPYMDDYINPPEFLEAQRQKLLEEQARQKRVPEQPERDVLLFLLSHAPLEEWQSDVMAIVREEAYYFVPQGQTKIMNEGWASYWHSKIMTERALGPDELVDYADHHAGILASSPGRLNPYKLGLELWRDIEERWDKGQFGAEWDECEDDAARRNWDRKLGLGRQKIFEVRRIYNDVGFIDAFLTPEFARRHNLFTYKYDPETNEYVIDSREFQAIKQQLLFQLTNFGQPIILVQDANYANRGELYLRHQHEGVDLRLDWARDTLANIQTVWSRPVHLETQIEGVPKLFSYDGKEQLEKKLSS